MEDLKHGCSEAIWVMCRFPWWQYQFIFDVKFILMKLIFSEYHYG